MMRGYQLKAVCSQYDTVIKPYFRGLFFPDTTQNALQMIDPNKPNFLIFNSDFSHEEGSHWIGAFIDLQNQSYFIDSYAKNPNFYDLEEFMATATGNDYKTLPKPLQSKYTTICGIYCIYFGHHLCSGESLDGILKKMPNTTKILRDQQMVEWFEKRYGSVITLNKPWLDCNRMLDKGDSQKCKTLEELIHDRKTV